MFPEVSVFLSNEIQKSAKVPGRIDQVSVPQGIALAGIVYSNVVSTADPILKIEGLFQDEAVRRTLAPLFEEARKIEVRLSLRNNSDRSRSILAEMIFVGAAQDSINQVCFFTIDPISGIRYVRPLDDN